MTAQSFDRMNRVCFDPAKKLACVTGGKADGFVERQQFDFFRAARTKAAETAFPIDAHDENFVTFGRNENFL
jgi:hypothetical protein